MRVGGCNIIDIRGHTPRKETVGMTKNSIDTLINLISLEQEHCRRNKGKSQTAEQVEYWQKEIDDLEKLSEELWAEGILS